MYINMYYIIMYVIFVYEYECNVMVIVIIFKVSFDIAFLLREFFILINLFNAKSCLHIIFEDLKQHV